MAEALRQVPTAGAVRLTLSGHVQGVGFRPFVYRLAQEHGIVGEVRNTLGEVAIVACGERHALERFCDEVVLRAPPLARPELTGIEALAPFAATAFHIGGSDAQSDANIFVPPDFFMCDDCRRELHDPADRRYRYPFINCTQCGPRYTLIETLPYDRPNTSMRSFELCPACEREYLDPADRRFHAEPVACPDCGPSLSYESESVKGRGDALERALAELRAGRTLAVKGIGGYHLLCDANSEQAVRRLRRRKRRPSKPLAVMLPSLADAQLYVELDSDEIRALTAPARPIVLARALRGSELAASIAPGLDTIGVFLPYSPLHEMLLSEFGGPLVATSGNLSGEPVLTENAEGRRRLKKIADAFLHHDRPIVRPADDSVYRKLAGRVRPLRLGRGNAPLELSLERPQAVPTLAVGGHMKGAVALSWGRRIVVSPHIGEMDSPRSLAVFEQVARDLQSLYGVTAERVVCDAHPGYTTTRWAKQQHRLEVSEVWHHDAHASAIAAEFPSDETWLVFAWDGVGLGRDGTLWGGETLLGNAGHWERVASLRPFRLPGGERAGREPWRSAAALHWTCHRDWDACPDGDGLVKSAWERGLNSPETSAAGRLFDAAAALVCESLDTSFEAEGPMQLESLCRKRRSPVRLPLRKNAGSGLLRIDWQPLLEVIGDPRIDAALRAEIFHASLAHALLDTAESLREARNVKRVGLSGGVFQNRFFAEHAAELLVQRGFDVYLPEALPVNDAALCFGQAAHVAWAG